MLFRFVGGVSEIARRVRRAELLDKILCRYGFAVECAGDLVLARLHGVSAEDMKRRLQMIGRLIGFTRQLDVLLHNEDIIQKMVDCFMDGSIDPLTVLHGNEESFHP